MGSSSTRCRVRYHRFEELYLRLRMRRLQVFQRYLFRVLIITDRAIGRDGIGYNRVEQGRVEQGLSREGLSREGLSRAERG